MKNMFFYTHLEPISPKEGETEVKFTEIQRAFNLNKVVLVHLMEDERVAIVLDDYHERLEEIPVYNNKGKITAYKNKAYTHQTVFYLNKEDGQRFIDLTKVE